MAKEVSRLAPPPPTQAPPRRKPGVGPAFSSPSMLPTWHIQRRGRRPEACRRWVGSGPRPWGWPRGARGRGGPPSASDFSACRRPAEAPRLGRVGLRHAPPPGRPCRQTPQSGPGHDQGVGRKGWGVGQGGGKAPRAQTRGGDTGEAHARRTLVDACSWGHHQ